MSWGVVWGVAVGIDGRMQTEGGGLDVMGSIQVYAPSFQGYSIQARRQTR